MTYAFAPNVRLAVVGVGVHFFQLPDDIRTALEEFVNARLNP